MVGLRVLILFYFSMAINLSAFCQEKDELNDLLNQAEKFFEAKKYDSALALNLKAVRLVLDNNTNPYYVNLSPRVMLITGKCYQELIDTENAHKFLRYSLTLARANKHPDDIAEAFIELNKLHWTISRKNLSFKYPDPAITEEREMFFPVSKVEQFSSDSIRITILAGRNDGITDSIKKGGLISRYDYKNKNRPYLLVNCYVREISDNYLIAHARYDSVFTVKEGDLASLKARIPLNWRKLHVGNALTRGIVFTDNYRNPIFQSRYLYYYADSLSNDEIVLTSKKQIDEIVSLLAEDTAKGEYIDRIGEKGIFAGEHVMRALSRSNNKHIKLFLDFASEFSRTYAGSPFKFSEVYATWIINNTPLAPSSVLPWLLEITDKKERIRMAANLEKDINENELIEKWFNQGMLMANIDNVDSAFYIATLLKDACIALHDTKQEGWSDYLAGYTEKKMGNYKTADSCFRIALNKFITAGNKEGETWASNALNNISLNRDVAVTVQTGHVFQYLMAPSPNSRYLATAGSYDRTVKIWDVIQSRTIASFSAHDEGINSISYSPNGRYIVTASDDNTIKIWNAYDYSLLKKINRPKAELSVIFTPDSKQLVAGGYDSLIKFIDLGTHEIVRTLKKHRGPVTTLCFLPTNENYLFSGGNDSMVYKWDLEENDWRHWYSAKGRILQLDISKNGKYMSLTCSDTLVRVWKLNNNQFYFSTIPNFSLSGNPDIAVPSFSPDGNFLAIATRIDSLRIIDLETFMQRDYRFKTETPQGMYDLVFSPDGSYLAARVNYGGPLRIFNFSGWDFLNHSIIGMKEIKQYANLPVSVQFTKDDKNLAVVHEAISRLDLRNGSTTQLYYGTHLFQNNYILLNDEKTGIYSDINNKAIYLYDYVNKKEVLKLALPDTTASNSIKRFELTADNQTIFLADQNLTVSAFSLPQGKLIFSKKYDHDSITGIVFLRYDSLRKKIFIISNNNKIAVADPQTGAISHSFTADNPQTIEVTPTGLYITCDKGFVYKYDATTYQLVKKIKVYKGDDECYGSVMSHNYDYLVVQVADKFVTLSTKADSVLYEKYDHDYANGIMAVSHNNQLLATGGFDSRINIYNLSSGNKIASIYTPRGKDFMLVDSEGYYAAPKSTLDAVNFSFNNSSYGFEQFDIRYNRPDMVLPKLGMADSALIKIYHAAWKKRLRKLNLSENDLGADIHLPVTRLKDKFAIKPGTPLREYNLPIECFDARYPLQSLHVMVNNNPLFGVTGKPICGKTSRYIDTVKIPLSEGPNKVKVYCTNANGTASLAEYIEINSSFKSNTPPKTYFIGIAVSSYKDSKMNLRYAAKDVRDLAGAFGKMFKNFEADTLIDKLATKENILALRKKLLKTSVNDKIIISVNGHGLLDDSLNFYFATYDVNFRKPEIRGLKYEDLEALLDGIPARKKLLLIDACHSGALDKEEILAQQKKAEQTKKQKDESSADTIKAFAARGTITRNKQSTTDAGSTYEVMQNLFADLSAGNGAVIISAAGGMEYAFESDKWNNGVFTYCIRRGIEEDLADKEGGNGDMQVDVAELKNYVSRRVFELTGGKQRPVSRRENIEYNWIVW